MIKPPMIKKPLIEEVKKPVEIAVKKEATPVKKKVKPPPIEDDDDEYFDEEAEKEKDRLRRLRNMNRRAHRGFAQSEIMMMRWLPSPVMYPEGETEKDWECQICHKTITGMMGGHN